MFDKPNDNPKIVAKNLLMAMPYKEAQKFCVMKEIEARHKVEELSKRHMEEYLTARKEKSGEESLVIFLTPKIQKMKTFQNIEYIGGHPFLTRPRKVNVIVDPIAHEVMLKEAKFVAPLSVTIKRDDIIDITYDEKSKRSIGKTAAGAVLGGVLTGGIGLIVGGAIGATRRDISNLYFTVNVAGRQHNIILKAGRMADDIYAAINGL